MGDRAQGVRDRTDAGHDPGSDRRPQTGDLRVPRRRRLRLPRRRRERRYARDARCQPPQRPAAARRPRRALRPRPPRPPRDRVPARVRQHRATERRACSARPAEAALRVRLLPPDEPRCVRTASGFPNAESTRAFIARDLAADVVSAAQLRSPRSSGATMTDSRFPAHRSPPATSRCWCARTATRG